MKKSSGSKQKNLGSIFLLLALGLHGVLLMIPMGSSEPPLKEKPVKVVKLSNTSPKITAKPSVNLVKRATLPKPIIAKSPNQSAKSPNQLPVPSPQVAPISSPKPTPVAPVEKPAPPQPSESAAKSDKSLPPKPEDELKDFSQVAGAQIGCSDGEECWQVEDTQWRAIAEKLTQRLEQQGYQVGKLDDLEDETGMGVYRVARNGETKYLHLLLTDGGTVYLLDPKQLTREELERRVQEM